VRILTLYPVLVSYMHRTLDLSFNNLKSVPDTLHNLTSLDTVYFVQNRISKINGLDALGATLRSLELGGNRIRVCSTSLTSLKDMH
jgi:Leucine-rich repeat (LRR) protein